MPCYVDPVYILFFTLAISWSRVINTGNHFYIIKPQLVKIGSFTDFLKIVIVIQDENKLEILSLYGLNHVWVES